ncbi:ABC transporter ATP-binding protein [Amycolatopsis granulosa]|uniref:ABC transporter ATP-binding protein n=1 Tax=Amycolatopsis granulosa TaxID=185684 RepID=UPI0014236541|nr:ABC transporter ATP-binding protein [Amycolatopsis granulosa]NIH83796.1 ABC-type multidrug transport system ATPase subunit [Amycolatopsis granulosa]
MSIEARGLGVVAGDTELFEGLDFTVSPGECMVVSGPNGAGKSTLLRCVYGSQPLTSGTVTVFGSLPDERSAEFRRRVSVLLDDSAVFEELTPRQHMDLLLRSFPDAAALADVEGLLATAGLAGRLDLAAGALSAGQRRRLLLVAALARPHEALLLDEPERALDDAGREWLAGLIEKDTAAGAAVIVASHHEALADEVAHSVLEFA